MKKLYATGLVEDVHVSSTPTETGLQVTIDLQAAPLVKSVTFTGLSPEEETALRPLLRAEEGKRLTVFDLGQDTRLIREKLAKTKTPAPEVTSRRGYNEEKGVANVTFTIK